MKFICKWRKTLVIIALLVIVAALSLSMLAFKDRGITIEDESYEFCYETSEVYASNNPHKKYPNVHQLMKVDCTVQELLLQVYSIGDSMREYRMTEDIDVTWENISVMGLNDGSHSGIEVYLILNTSSDAVLQFAPIIEHTQEGNMAKLTLSLQVLPSFGVIPLKAKLLIKVI